MQVATNERIGETCDILDLDDIDGLDLPTVPQVEPTSRRPLEERRSRA